MEKRGGVFWDWSDFCKPFHSIVGQKFGVMYTCLLLSCWSNKPPNYISRAVQLYLHISLYLDSIIFVGPVILMLLSAQEQFLHIMQFVDLYKWTQIHIKISTQVQTTIPGNSITCDVFYPTEYKTLEMPCFLSISFHNISLTSLYSSELSSQGNELCLLSN